jgi:hypothetical protein
LPRLEGSRKKREDLIPRVPSKIAYFHDLCARLAAKTARWTGTSTHFDWTVFFSPKITGSGIIKAAETEHPA